MTKKIGSCIIAATLTVAAAMALGPTTTAQAGTITDLTCSACFEFDFITPLTAKNASSAATLRGTVVSCNGPASKPPAGLLSATAEEGTAGATSVGTGACNLLLTITGDGSLHWNTGEESIFHFTVNTDPLNDTVTLSADIVSGPLAGGKINALPVLAHPNLDCATKGLIRLTSEEAVVIFKH